MVTTLNQHAPNGDSLNNNFNPLPDRILTPINTNVLEAMLTNHPNREFVNYLISGFTNGFFIGFQGELSAGQNRNLLSARNNPVAVTAAIQKELQRGHTSGPFDNPPYSLLHLSPLGAVPKKDDTHRIILDLSSPRGSAINEGISADEYSVKYSTFDDAVDLVVGLGKGSYMAKLDIKHAFRLCPVHPHDWPLLGYTWNGHYFLDTRLPFGSRSSPYIFNQFADALLWILVVIFGIPYIVHYLDDFFLCANTYEECSDHMTSMQSVFGELGVPLAPEKVVGPTTTLTYLGIEINTKTMSMQLPTEKFSELLSNLEGWLNRKKCTKRELLSLIGSLSFACKVVKPGRMFLRRLIHLSCTATSLNHHISLNAEARADIKWWIDFLPSWNGIAIIQEPPVTSYALTLHTDASALGFGAVFSTHWFSLPWPASLSPIQDINFCELFAVVAAVFTWGDHWQNQQILFYTDNLSITNIWKSGSCRDQDIMRLVRALFLFIANRNINILMCHIPGKFNDSADALSRLQIAKFRRLNPQADFQPTPVSPDVWLL